MQDDVHLGVVEERVLVQVRRPDREEAVVDDGDLRVHVHDPSAAPRLVQSGREEAPGAAVGVEQHAELSARVVHAVVRMRGENDDDAEVVARRTTELVGEHHGHLARPEELALEIDEPLGPPQRAQVALENGELALRHPVVDRLRDGAHELNGRPAERLLPFWRRQLARPPQPEVLGDVGDHRPLEPNARVVPPQPPSRRMVAPVEAVAGERRQIDPADVRDAIVDEDELLVVAVHRTLLRVQLHLDAGAVDELVAHLPHLAAIGMEERQRRARPREHAHRNPFRHLTEQCGQRRPAVAQEETRREEPARKMDV